MAPITEKEITKHPAAGGEHVAHAPHKAAAHPVVAHGVHTAHTAAHKDRYTEATGRRKTAVARVRITPGSGKVIVNGKDLKGYFTLPRLMASAVSPLEKLNLMKDYDLSVKVSGGGIHAQAEAVRHGLSRALVAKTPDWKPRLRAMGFLTRDSRMVERKKYGLLKARRAPQWAKR